METAESRRPLRQYFNKNKKLVDLYPDSYHKVGRVGYAVSLESRCSVWALTEAGADSFRRYGTVAIPSSRSLAQESFDQGFWGVRKPISGNSQGGSFAVESVAALVWNTPWGSGYHGCGVRIAIHGADPELIVKSCEMSSGLTTIQRQCAISLFYSFTWCGACCARWRRGGRNAFRTPATRRRSSASPCSRDAEYDVDEGAGRG